MLLRSDALLRKVLAPVNDQTRMRKSGRKEKRARGNNNDENSTPKGPLCAKRASVLGVNKTANAETAEATSPIPGLASPTTASIVVGVTGLATTKTTIPGLPSKSDANNRSSPANQPAKQHTCGSQISNLNEGNNITMEEEILGWMEPEVGDKVRQVQEELKHAIGEGNHFGMDQDNLHLGVNERAKRLPELMIKWKYYLIRSEIPEWVKADWPRIDYVKTENAMLVGFAALASYQYFFGMFKLPSKKISQSMHESCQNRGLSEDEVVDFIQNHLFADRPDLLARVGTKKIMECRIPNWFDYLKKKAGLKGVFVLSKESLTEQKLRGVYGDHVASLVYFLPYHCDCFTKKISKTSPAGNNDAADGDAAPI